MAGFSLVEVMVAMVVGLLGMIVMMQVFAMFEGQKRSTTGSGEAQNTGAITLYSLQRDLQQAGFGTSSLGMLGCNLTLPLPLSAPTTTVTINNMAPLTINAAAVVPGDANTDTLLIYYGNSSSPTEGDGLAATPTGSDYPMQTPTSFGIGDQVIGVPPTRLPLPAFNPVWLSTCTSTLNLIKVIASGGTASPPTSTITTATAMAGVINNSLVYNLGPGPTIRAYAIRNSNLTVCDYTVSNCGDASQVANTQVWMPVASNMVSLRAQYGRDTSAAMDGIVDLYDQTTPANACDWIKTSAVRIALVARNEQFEKTAVTAKAPVWDGGPASGVAATPAGSATTPINLAANAKWQNYRYKVFQTTIPLRNVTWMGVQTGC